MKDTRTSFFRGVHCLERRSTLGARPGSEMDAQNGAAADIDFHWRHNFLALFEDLALVRTHIVDHSTVHHQRGYAGLLKRRLLSCVGKYIR